MSKLQEALQKLRSESASTTARADRKKTAPMVGGAMSRNRDAVKQSATVKQSNILDSANAGPGYRPARTITIDARRLQEYGLHPEGSDGQSVDQEFRRIKRPILNYAFGDFDRSSENANAIMIASALPMSGKTFCSFSLSISIARERDSGAVLVDADVLKPNISHALNLEDSAGLIDYLLDPDLSIDDILIGTDLHDIVVVPAGRSHGEATELLASRRMRQFIENLSNLFPNRAVIFDTPPLLLTNEAHVLSENMGQIVLVIEAGTTLQDSVVRALSSLNQNKPINAILNKTQDHSFGEYGGSGYGYYAAPSKERVDVRKS